jgi:hypothetical protein
MHIQSMMRRHAMQFIDRRDFLEGRIGKLNRASHGIMEGRLTPATGRLAYLVSESQAWKTQFEIFQNFAKSLTTEAQELKTRLEKERREAKRRECIRGCAALRSQRKQSAESYLISSNRTPSCLSSWLRPSRLGPRRLSN